MTLLTPPSFTTNSVIMLRLPYSGYWAIDKHAVDLALEQTLISRNPCYTQEYRFGQKFCTDFEYMMARKDAYGW